MKNHLKQKWFIIVVLALFLFSDCAVTLIGQPHSYWTNYSMVREGSPLWSFCLKTSPYVYICGWFIYWIMASIIALLLPRNVSLIYVTTIIVIHTCAMYGWFRYHFGGGWQTELWYAPVANNTQYEIIL